MHSQADCLQAFSPGQFHCIDQQISVDITDQAVLIQVSSACLFPGIEIAGKKMKGCPDSCDILQSDDAGGTLHQLKLQLGCCRLSRPLDPGEKGPRAFIHKLGTIGNCQAVLMIITCDKGSAIGSVIMKVFLHPGIPLILAKFLDTFLILSNIYIAAGLFSLIVKLFLKVTLSPDQAKYIVLVLFSDVLCTTASVVIAAAFFYLTENTTLGIIAYLAAELLIPLALEFVNMFPNLARYHPERFYFSGAASSMVTDFIIGATEEGILKLLLILAVYIFGATLATILLFQKKELNF